MRALKFNTDGKGLWSDKAASIGITDIGVDYIDVDDLSGGELLVIFDKKDWDIDTDGFIYTDKQFLRDLQGYLNSRGLPGWDVDYSEKGMQGREFVSFDFGAKFLQAWNAKGFFGNIVRD